MVKIVEYRDVELSALTIGKGQVRLRNVAKDLPELVESIRKHGLLEPIVVCPSEEEGKYEIITGQRRFLAHQELEYAKIPAAILSEKVDETTAKVLSVTENLIRKDLNSSDLIDVCTFLYKKYGSMRAVAEETALPYDTVRRYVKYEQLVPELKDTHAYPL